VGMSFGGWLALNLAMIAPERIRKLVLLSPAASFQPLVKQFMLRGMLMGLFPTRLTVNSNMGWMGIKDTPDAPGARCILELIYLGMKHFRLPQETMRIMPGMFSDDELHALGVPVLLLIGDREVIYDPAKALARARALIPNFEGELVPRCNHDMCFSQHRIVDARVLDFLKEFES
jgi:pimeloyl-ACP methyl ester carboxylesterase